MKQFELNAKLNFIPPTIFHKLFEEVELPQKAIRS
jgi:hypothetical protein